jgi:hypothetical protein
MPSRDQATRKQNTENPAVEPDRQRVKGGETDRAGKPVPQGGKGNPSQAEGESDEPDASDQNAPSGKGLPLSDAKIVC